jgi:cytochrome c-type biogenesis protein
VNIDSLALPAAGLAFAAGLVSFLSPCVLPLLPAYLSYVSGVSVDSLESERGKVLRVALAFVAGFTVVFVALGAGAGGVGRFLSQYRTLLTIVAGAFLVISGLVIMGLLHLPGRGLSRMPRARGLPGAFLTGAAVCVGWTPCVGPVLGSILTIAGARESAAGGALLLFIYSLGLGLPFVLAALAFGWAGRRLAAIKRHYRAFQLTAGIVLVVVGVLFITGTFDSLSRALSELDPLSL